MIAHAMSVPLTLAVADQPKPVLAWLNVEVSSTTILDKVPAYVGLGGDGDDLEKQEINIPGMGGGMNSILIQHEHTYVAGEVTSRDNFRMLVVQCRFANVSASPENFHPLDVRFNGSDSALVAAGTGTYPFAKAASTWDRLRKELMWSLGSEDTRSLVYVFEVPKDAANYRLMYNGVQIAELHPVTQ